jgi:predicted RNase H-like HicB family nuclease
MLAPRAVRQPIALGRLQSTCQAVAESRAEVIALIRDAIEFHIEGLKKSGDPVPGPDSQSELVDVHAA